MTSHKQLIQKATEEEEAQEEEEEQEAGGALLVNAVRSVARSHRLRPLKVGSAAAAVAAAAAAAAGASEEKEETGHQLHWQVARMRGSCFGRSYCIAR